MPWISTEAAEALHGSTVRLAVLAELQCRLETMHLWTGFSSKTIGGQVYQGAGSFGSVEELAQGRTHQSDVVTLTMECVTPQIAALAAASQTDVRGRLGTLSLQLFDDDWQVIGPPIPVFWGPMQRIKVERKPATVEGGGARIAKLEIENAFSGRSRPRNGLFTDAHQRRDFPVDNFFRFKSKQRTSKQTWPDY